MQYAFAWLIFCANALAIDWMSSMQDKYKPNWWLILSGPVGILAVYLLIIHRRVKK